MSCITFIAYGVAYRQVAEAACYEIVNASNLRSSWQMVADSQGRRRLEMRWKAR